jgi:hypothetical protein
MKLELTIQEQSLLLDSIFSRIRQIEKLLESFEEPKLIEMYSNDKVMLQQLQTKLIHQYGTEAI